MPAGEKPRGLRIVAGLALAWLAVFAATAPWRVAGREMGRWSFALGVAALALAVALAVRPGWRRVLTAQFRREGPQLPRSGPWVAGALAAAFFGRLLAARWAALELNAWDLTLFFDRPIAETLAGRLLYCDFYGRSYLGTHASFLLFAFVPFYALVSTPLWLLAAQALAAAAAGVAGYLLFRRLTGDDLSGAFLAAAFWSNTYTAKAVQYAFHIEIFYPLALFGLLAAFEARRPALFAAALVLALSIKEDAFLVLSGFAVTAAFVRRRPVWGACAFVAAVAVFVFDSRWVLPHFSGSAHPWYAFYWKSFGSTPLDAATSMAVHPMELAAALSGSGLRDLFEPLLAFPLAGAEWLLAALPALVPYAAADYAPLSHFLLYYSMPVLPMLFAATAAALPRLAGLGRTAPGVAARLLRQRLLALAILLVCAFDGAGYSFPRRRLERTEIAPLLASLPSSVPVLIQGALLPRAGYASNRRPLDRDTPIGPHDAVLLDPAANPYPRSSQELEALVARLSADPSRRLARSPHGLLLFAPP
ncbi:MAG TPA: DUF2079 domain-containing protein [Thermoanaerobaculia bacterium]|nr:DUF2079 domain-containing protein [Thermoanaerobaculia bacterium]